MKILHLRVILILWMLTLGPLFALAPLSGIKFPLVISDSLDYEIDHIRACYPQLMPYISRDIQNLLKNNPHLMPVFLLHLTDQTEPLENHNTPSEVSKELIDFYTGIKLNSPLDALNYLKKGHSIRVGVSIKPSFDTLTPVFSSSIHGRQAFFPIFNPQGEIQFWLGLKGLGQFIDPKKPQYYKFESRNEKKYIGLVSEKEALKALRLRSLIQHDTSLDSNAIVEYLGHKKLKAFFNADGELKPLTELHLIQPSNPQLPYQPVLVFNKTTTIDRWIGFPQAIKAYGSINQYLQKYFSQYSNDQDHKLQVLKYIKNGIKKLAKTLAIMANHEIYKTTFHAQDITPDFSIADNEESSNASEILEFLIKKNYDPQIIDFFRKNPYGLFNFIDGLKFINDLISFKDIKPFINVDDFLALENAYFQAYFAHLDDKQLKNWATHLVPLVINGQIQQLSFPFLLIKHSNFFDIFKSSFYSEITLSDFNQLSYQILLHIQNTVKHEFIKRGFNYPAKPIINVQQSETTIANNIRWENVYTINSHPSFSSTLFDDTVQIMMVPNPSHLDNAQIYPAIILIFKTIKTIATNRAPDIILPDTTQIKVLQTPHASSKLSAVYIPKGSIMSFHDSFLGQNVAILQRVFTTPSGEQMHEIENPKMKDQFFPWLEMASEAEGSHFSRTRNATQDIFYYKETPILAYRHVNSQWIRDFTKPQNGIFANEGFSFYHEGKRFEVDTHFNMKTLSVKRQKMPSKNIATLLSA